MDFVKRGYNVPRFVKGSTKITNFRLGVHELNMFPLTHSLPQFIYTYKGDRLCGLVIRVLGYRFGGPSSIPGSTRK
jgi:hypothetical protein